jgi:hypothetical protein
MESQRLPALLLSMAALGFVVWAIFLVTGPGGPTALEWTILLVAVCLLGFGLMSRRVTTPQRATAIRWVLVGFAVFGVTAVIGLTADDSSSRTWVRLGWAALIVGLVSSLLAWWGAPRIDRRTVIAGGVLGLILVAGGVGITVNCDRTLQRSWCEPAFEQEETLAARLVVQGAPDRQGRAGGDTGAYVRAFIVDGADIEAVTTVPEPFTFEDRPIQSIEVSRGRYTATSGPYRNCQIDAKVETVPAGDLLTFNVSCRSQT